MIERYQDNNGLDLAAARHEDEEHQIVYHIVGFVNNVFCEGILTLFIEGGSWDGWDFQPLNGSPNVGADLELLQPVLDCFEWAL